MQCPICQSERIRRGGTALWTVYLVLIALGVPSAVVFHLNAAIVAAIMLAVVVLANLVVAARICLDCGNQWRP